MSNDCATELQSEQPERNNVFIKKERDKIKRKKKERKWESRKEKNIHVQIIAINEIIEGAWHKLGN